MKTRKKRVDNDKETLTERDAYLINTTAFRRRRFDRRFAGIFIAFLLLLIIVGTSLFFIFTGRSRIPDRRAKITDKVEIFTFVEDEKI